MFLVVAVDQGWGIGNKGDLLVRIRGDLKNFAALTTGKTVILGAKTLATFPGGRVLKNRRNIVLSRNPAYAPEGAVMARSLEEVLALTRDMPSSEVCVIGGASIYEQLLPYCDCAFVTKIQGDFEKDAYFPDLDADPAWECVSESEVMVSTDEDLPAGVEYTFCEYRRR